MQNNVQEATPCDLARYIAAKGPQLDLRGKTYKVEGISGDCELAVATIAGPRAKYTGVVSVHRNLLIKYPGAELWYVLNKSGAQVASFAIHDGSVIAL
jgi:hypothetical protein